MNTVFLFPGQGSQRPNMLHELIDDVVIDETLDEIRQAVGLDICLLDSELALRSTVSVQLSLLASGVATARFLLQRGVQPIAVVGLSVGAFAAAVIAGVISLGDGARLVRSRAEQMQSLYPRGYGMAAIVGLAESQVEEVVRQINSSTRPLFVANINAPRQIVVAGSIDSLEAAVSEARACGASKAEVLPVSVPSHCSLLEPVAASLRTQLKDIVVRDPKILYIANVTARTLRSGAVIAKDLADNIAHSVRWHDVTTVAQELGAKLFLEMPPGHVLSNLARNNLQDVAAYPVQPETVFHLIERGIR